MPWQLSSRAALQVHGALATTASLHQGLADCDFVTTGEVLHDRSCKQIQPLLRWTPARAVLCLDMVAVWTNSCLITNAEKHQAFSLQHACLQAWSITWACSITTVVHIIFTLIILIILRNCQCICTKSQNALLCHVLQVIYIYMYIDCKPKADVELVLPDDSLHDSFFLDPAKFKIHVH